MVNICHCVFLIFRFFEIGSFNTSYRVSNNKSYSSSRSSYTWITLDRSTFGTRWQNYIFKSPFIRTQRWSLRQQIGKSTVDTLFMGVVRWKRCMWLSPGIIIKGQLL